jgi:hypothetical protein
VTHIVIHDGGEATTQYCQFDDLETAVSYLEELRNTEEVEDAKLFVLDEVMFEVKQYFKVEVLDPAPVSADDTTVTPIVESLQTPEVLPTAEDATYVEAAMQGPIEATAVDTAEPETPRSPVGFEEPIEAVVPGGGSDSRRGLFGR